MIVHWISWTSRFYEKGARLLAQVANQCQRPLDPWVGITWTVLVEQVRSVSESGCNDCYCAVQCSVPKKKGRLMHSIFVDFAALKHLLLSALKFCCP